MPQIGLPSQLVKLRLVCVCVCVCIHRYNDLRQAGVGYCEGGLVIHLIAAEE